MSKRLYIPLPNKISRDQLLKMNIDKENKNKKLFYLTKEDYNKLNIITKGFSGSDLMNLISL